MLNNCWIIMKHYCKMYIFVVTRVVFFCTIKTFIVAVYVILTYHSIPTINIRLLRRNNIWSEKS